MFKFIKISLISVLLTLACQNQIFAPQDKEVNVHQNLIKLGSVLNKNSLKLKNFATNVTSATWRAANQKRLALWAADWSTDVADWSTNAATTKTNTARVCNWIAGLIIYTIKPLLEPQIIDVNLKKN